MVDGVAVTKEITRLTLREELITGAYFGALTLLARCGTNIVINRQLPVNIGIVKNGANVAVEVTTLGGAITCTYTGPCVQHGRTTQEKGTFPSEMRPSVNGLVTHLEASFTSVDVNPGTPCTCVGAIAGAYLGLGGN